MNKLFIKPEIDIYKFAVEDIVCASGWTNDEQQLIDDDNNHDFT